MSHGEARPPITRLWNTAVLLALVAFGAACEAISGVNEIDFTSLPGAGGAGGGGGGGDGGDEGAGGGAGGGGEGSYDISCGAGNVPVGIFGRSGAWLDNLGLLCARVLEDGSLSPTFETESAGGDGGSPGEATCPPDQVVVGFTIWSDASVVYRVDPHCQTMAAWQASSESYDTVEGFGPEHGQSVTFICYPSVFADQIFGDASDYVLTMEFLCHAP